MVLGLFDDVSKAVTAPARAITDVSSGFKSVGKGVGGLSKSVGRIGEQLAGGVVDLAGSFGSVFEYLPLMIIGGGVIAVVVVMKDLTK